MSFHSANTAGQNGQEEKHDCLGHSFSSLSLSLPVCLYCAEAGWLPESPGIRECWDFNSLIHTSGDEPWHRGCVKKWHVVVVSLQPARSSSIHVPFTLEYSCWNSRPLNITDVVCSQPFSEVKYCVVFLISFLFLPVPLFPTLCCETQLSQLLRPCNRHSWKDSEAVPVTPLDSLYQSFKKPDSVIREQMAYQKAPVLASNYTFNAHLNFKHAYRPGSAASPFVDYWAIPQMTVNRCYNVIAI